MQDARLVSVNTGKPEKIATRSGLSGIFKRPVDGPVAVGPLGLAGDAILDRKHHGGTEQAVYIYLAADYDWWMEELGRPLEPGTFGENLTIGGLDGAGLAVGDRFTIGEVVLEVTSHREPCATFAARMGDPKWVRRFHRAHRPGAYARVLRSGPVAAGMTVGYAPFSGETVVVAELVDIEGAREIDPEFMRRALKAPLHKKMRADFEARLAAET